VTQLDYRVELALQPVSTAAADLLWRDVTPWVRGSEPVSITRGRPDRFADVTPGRCTVTVNNRDGRFTPGYASGAYFPEMELGRRLRVAVRYPPQSAQPGNLVANSTFEVDASGWAGNTLLGTNDLPTSVARSTTRAWQGSASLLVTWPTTAIGSCVLVMVPTVKGRTYTMSAYVWVPSGSPDVRVFVPFTANSALTSTKDAWVRLSVTFTGGGADFVGVQCTSATSGQTVYVDAVQVDEGAAPVSFTPDAPPISYRFTGYVDELPVSWSAGVDGRATIGATDRLNLLSRSTLRSMLEEEILDALPGDVSGTGGAYYPLSEPEGATRAANAGSLSQSDLIVGQVGAGGTAEFGAGTGPGTDGLTALILTPVNASNGKRLNTFTFNYAVGYFQAHLSCWFVTLTASREIARVRWGSDYMSLSIDASNKVVGTVTAFGATVATVTSANSVTDGQTHRVSVEQEAVGTTTTVRLYLDDAVAVTTTFTGADGVVHPYNSLQVGGGPGTLFAGTVSHVVAARGVLSAAQHTAEYTAGVTGGAGERSDQRIARLARFADVPGDEQQLETGLSTSMSAQTLAGQSPLAAMQAVRATESGVLFVDGQGRLVFHGRGRRYLAVSALTLGADAVGSGDALAYDTSLLVNSVTATRGSEAGRTSVNRDSVAAFGVYDTSLDLLTTLDAEVESAADWRANADAWPTIRMPNVSVDLSTAPSGTPLAALLAADLSTRLTVGALPNTAPATPIDLFVEGVTENWSAGGCSVQLVTSNAAAAGGAWVLGDAALSVLGVSTKLVY
jgi:hypothetical protein